MPGPDDYGLLRQYVASGDDAAFAQLSRRYVSLVYSAALRQVGDRHLAEDVTQAVFLVLAKKARWIRSGTPLSAWLHKTTRYAAIDARRARERRQRAERRAAEMTQQLAATAAEASGEDDWRAIAPVLDEAVARLRAVDRQAVLLRYFENKSLAEVGAVLGISPDAARKRLDRAVMRMRDFFGRRGVHVSATALAPILVTHAVEPAPEPLRQQVRSAGAGGAGAAGAGAVAVSMLARSIARGARRAALWHQARHAAAILVVASAAIAVVGAAAPDAHPLAWLGLGPPRDPIEGINRFSAALRAGDGKAMLALVHTRNPVERRRAEATVRLHLALRRFRIATDRRFGAGAMAKAGFMDGGGGDLAGCTPTYYFHVPQFAPTRKWVYGRVMVPVPEGEVAMVPEDGTWKIDEPVKFDMVMTALRSQGNALFSEDMEVLTQSTVHMAQLYESVASQVEARKFASAKDVIAALDEATGNAAHLLPPRPAALLVDVGAPESESAAASSRPAG